MFLTASVVVSIIELYWGLDIGYPTMLNSPGGGYYVLWGLLHFIFSVMVLWAYVMKKTSLLKEWITMLWILSFFSVMIFWLAKVISLVYEVPPIYVEGRHLSVLLTGGVSELIFLCAMLYAIYGSATKERAIY